MRIIDKDNKVITEQDVNTDIGYLKPDKIFIRHHEKQAPVEEIPEVWHYEVIAVYPNGGKDVKRVIDKPRVPGHGEVPAWDEYEDIMRYILYTQEELDEMEKEKNRPSIDELNDAITDIQMAMADTYESDDTAITDIQMALAEIYEMLTAKEEDSNG